MEGGIPSAQPRRTRKTRFVCISDTHNASPKDGCFKLPPGDVLIHAGDLSNQGTFGELQQTIDWIAAADYEVKIVIAGNHDLTLDTPYYANNAERFHSRYPQKAVDCAALMHKYPSVVYLRHESRTIRLAKESGPRTEFRIFGSPYSPGNGYWAFGYVPKTGAAIVGSGDQTAISQASTARAGIGESNGNRGADGADDPESVSKQPAFLPGTWLDIPDDADLVVTHTPALGHCDAGREDRSCRHLKRALQRVKPRLALCGHIHEGWGAEMVTWHDSGAVSAAFDLPKAGNKLAKIDLTSKRGRSLPEPAADSNGRGADKWATCVVNAAIKARSRGQGDDGPMYNKPIVVDIDLPVWNFD